jgi:hypothetical protein
VFIDGSSTLQTRHPTRFNPGTMTAVYCCYWIHQDVMMEFRAQRGEYVEVTKNHDAFQAN